MYKVEFFFNTQSCYLSSSFILYYLTLSLSSANSQKKQIRSYLEKAVVREKGHLPVKEMNQKISLYFAGARFAFAS